MFQTDDYREVNFLFKSIHEVGTVSPLIEVLAEVLKARISVFKC